MANKKKKNAAGQKAVASPAASDTLAKDNEESEAGALASGESKSKKEAREAAKDAQAQKHTAKGKTVVKSQARAKDPKKAGKKPNIFRRFFEYLKQVRLEIKRTTWPTKNEVLNMTIIVLVALLFFGILIMIIDFILVFLLDQYANLVPAADPSSVDPSSVADASSGAVDGAADAPVDGSADGSADAGADGSADGADGADTADTADGAEDGGADAADTTEDGGE